MEEIVIYSKFPLISGTEDLRRIHEKGIQLPVTVATTFDNVKNVAECTKMGVVAYVWKPSMANRSDAIPDKLSIRVTGNSARIDMVQAQDLIATIDLKRPDKVLRNLLWSKHNPLRGNFA